MQSESKPKPLDTIAVRLELLRDELTTLPRVQGLHGIRRALSASADIITLLVKRAVIVPIGTPLGDLSDQGIAQTLTALDDNRAATARLLRISRRSLYDQLHASGQYTPKSQRSR